MFFVSDIGLVKLVFIFIMLVSFVLVVKLIVLMFVIVFMLLLELVIFEGLFGDMVCEGCELFVYIVEKVLVYVGNGLVCVNCYFDVGC